jgi:hypothetical protein
LNWFARAWCDVLQAPDPWGSDHVNFIKANIPAFLFIQKADIDFDHYHSTTDEETIVDYTLLEHAMRASVGTLYDVACPMANRDYIPAAPGPAPSPSPPPIPTTTRSVTSLMISSHLSADITLLTLDARGSA